MSLLKPRFLSLHKIVLIILVNTFPELLERYYKEYQEIMRTVFKEKTKKRGKK